MSRILIIDDEPQIRRFLTISLGTDGHQIFEAEDAGSGLALIATENPELVILDLGLPDMDGQDALRELRSFYHGPVLVLSVRGSETDKVKALDAGCNDYVVKPFAVKELLARVRNLLRTFTGVETPLAVFDDGYLQIDLGSRRVAREGEDIRLTRKELDLLKKLMSNSGRIVTQQQLLRELWGPSHIEDTHYLRIFIAKLRSKMGDNATEPRYIETEPGVGYRFVGDLSSQG